MNININKGTIDLFPYVDYLKNIEELKYIRKISFNYKNRIELSYHYYTNIMKSFPQDGDLIDLGKDMRSSYIRNEGYFLYKDSQISLSNYSFKTDCELNPNYHIY